MHFDTKSYLKSNRNHTNSYTWTNFILKSCKINPVNYK